MPESIYAQGASPSRSSRGHSTAWSQGLFSPETRSSVSGANVQAAPQRRPGEGEYHELPPETRHRRKKLALALDKLGTSLSLMDLMGELDLKSAFSDFEKGFGAIFTRSTHKVPVVSPLQEGDRLLESDYVRCFLEVIGQQASVLAKSKLPKQYREIPYQIMDTQNTPVYESTLKPDLVFAFNTKHNTTFRDIFLVLEAKKESGEDVYLKHIGQLADYALALRECQPTRTYVPVLFLNGRQLDLLVFTNSGYLHANIGPVLFMSDEDKAESRERQFVGQSLCCLWFLLTLPADRFGLLFDSPRIPS
ncbi:hypothetical protein GGH93_005886, partial [Coemansia aciculifera]